MKTQLAIITFAVCLLPIVGCNKPCEVRPGAYGSDTLSLPTWATILSIEGELSTTIIQDSISYVVIDGGLNLRENFQLYEDGSDTLRLQSLNNCRFLHGYDEFIRVEVHVPQLTHIVQRSPHDISFPKRFVSDSLTFDASGGSGDITAVDIQSTYRMRVNATKGASDITLNGSAGYVEVYSSDLSNIHLKGLKTSYVHAIHDGYGDIEVWSSFIGKADNYRSGNIFIFGQPDSVQITNIGTGSVTIE